MLLSVRRLLHSLQVQNLNLRYGGSAMSTSAVQNRKNYLEHPEDFSDISLPERPKLPILPKVPTLLPHQKFIKMKKNLIFMRGPEEVHNTLLHEQFGVMALTGGRLRYGHLEMIRLKVGRSLDLNRMFAIWRIDEPWQPVSKRGVGKRHGGGKGPIDHFVTPVKAGRIIFEVGGKCVFEEVKPWLDQIAHILPFKAIAVDQRTLLAMKKMEELKEQRNRNPYTFKYLIMNNMCGSQNWVKPIDKVHFGKYV